MVVMANMLPIYTDTEQNNISIYLELSVLLMFGLHKLLREILVSLAAK